jgi:trimeric autotransporter adhesin
MLKKGLATLISLAIMSALWSWGSTISFELTTKLTNPGGTIKVNNTLQVASGTAVYTNFTTAHPQAVTVSALAGYKISALLVNNVSQIAMSNHSTSYSANFSSAGGKLQSVMATFRAAAGGTGGSTGGGTGGGTSMAAWQMQLSNTSPGGAIVFGTLAQSGIGSVAKNYTATDVVPVTATITPAAGYQVVKVLTSGSVTAPGTNGYPGSVTVSGLPAPGAVVNYVTASYRLVGVTSSAIQPTGGGITPAAVTVVPGSTTQFTVAPHGPNYSAVNSISVSGYQGTPSYHSAPYNPSYPNANLVTLPYPGVVYVVLDNVTSPVSISATMKFDPIQESIGCAHCHNQVPGPVGQADPLWQASKHKINSIGCNSCHVTMPGTVVRETVDAASFKVLAAGGGTVGSYYCVTCHKPAIASDFEASVHFAQGKVCTTCHTSGVHNPDPAANICNTCHANASGDVDNHPVAINGAVCTVCHNPHSGAATADTGAFNSVHYNNISTGAYPASYVTSKASCANCHVGGSTDNASIRAQWAQSGHGATRELPWTAYDFKTRSECVRCHTTTGFIAYSSANMTAAWGVASDKTKEVLTCVGCHSDVAAGTVRKATPNRPFADEAGYTNHNVSSSNICVDCHSGRNNGESIAVQLDKPADFTNLSFIAPHYLTAAGSLQGKSGYLFPGRNYGNYSGNAHNKVGMTNANSTGSAGPCVACHMSATSKHLFKPVTNDQAGAITSITTNLCSNCHSAGLTATALEARRASFTSALSVLNAALVAGGHTYTASYPYFAEKNWGTGQNGANVMGAAFNYKLLAAEPGAYAHNPDYTKKLIVDSIDAAYNSGTVTGDISGALAGLVASGAITQAQADSLTAYKDPASACNSCHGFPPTALKNGGTHTTSTACTTCHVYTTPGADTHNNGTVDMKILACGSCHLTAASNPALATGSHAQHFATIGSSDPAITCTKCHVYNGQAAPHANGTVNLNGGCSAVQCHGSITPPTWGSTNANAACTKCHGSGTAVVTTANENVVAPSDASATDTGQVSTNLKTGAHQAHLLGLNGLSAVGSIDERCQNCHGALPTAVNHATGSSAPVFQGLANNGGATSASFSGGSCSNTYCHNPAGSGGTLMSANAGTGVAPSWTNSAYLADGTLKTLTNCNTCHKVPGESGFSSNASHAGVTIANDCAGCHGHNGDASGAVGHRHMDGILYANGSCDSCHGYPPMSAAQLAARANGEFVNAKIEDYPGGGGYHASHLLTSVDPSQGFTPCLPCHPSTSHRQGASVLQTNINIFDAADTEYRFNSALPKSYDNEATTCSNVSCHMKPSPAWKL